jgi:hypothetical protein
MDILSLVSALQLTRFGFRDVPPFWDRDLRELYEARLGETRARSRTPARPAALPPTRWRRGA